MKYAYGRVSAADQNLNRQIDSFIKNGVAKQHIFTDKKSGKDFDRENYCRLIGKLKKGDLLIVMSIDRLGRNYDMIIEEWTRITKTIGADILVLDMPILDTRSRSDNLTGKLISDIVLQLLSYVAQKERENINARQKEGIASARRRGVRFGRPKVPFPPGFGETVLAYKRREITLAQAMSRHGMKKACFYAKMRRFILSLSPLPTPPETTPPTSAPPAASVRAYMHKPALAVDAPLLRSAAHRYWARLPEQYMSAETTPFALVSEYAPPSPSAGIQ